MSIPSQKAVIAYPALVMSKSFVVLKKVGDHVAITVSVIENMKDNTSPKINILFFDLSVNIFLMEFFLYCH